MSDIGDNHKGKLESISLDLVPSVHHLFSVLKDHMRGQYYEKEIEVQEAVYSRLPGTGMDLYHSRICKFVQHWQKCMDHSGGFVEKW